jgi:hypothetical protein
VKNSLKRRNRRSGFAGKIGEVPTAVRSWKVAQDLSLSVQQEELGVIGTRFIGESGIPVTSLMLENRE